MMGVSTGTPGTSAVSTTGIDITIDGDSSTIDLAIEHDAGTGAPFYTHCNDVPDGVSSDYVQNDNSETSGTAWFTLSDMDVGFVSMYSLEIDVDVWAETAVTDDTILLLARVYDAEFGNPLTDNQIIGTEADTTRTQRTVSFGSLVGNKTQWDSAVILFSWIYSQNGGGDNSNLRLYGMLLDGEYLS